MVAPNVITLASDEGSATLEVASVKQSLLRASRLKIMVERSEHAQKPKKLVIRAYEFGEFGLLDVGQPVPSSGDGCLMDAATGDDPISALINLIGFVVLLIMAVAWLIWLPFALATGARRANTASAIMLAIEYGPDQGIGHSIG